MVGKKHDMFTSRSSTVAEIEREMFRIHSDLFASLAEASEYVTKVLLPDAIP